MENLRPVDQMTPEEVLAFVEKEGEPGACPYAKFRWIFSPVTIAALRHAVFADRTDTNLKLQYDDACRFYNERDRPCDSSDVTDMIAWWEPRQNAYPLILPRMPNGELDLWDGCHRLLHYICTGQSDRTVPCLIGIPVVGEGEPPYAPTCLMGTERVRLERAKYGNGRLALSATCLDGEPYCTVTTNMVDAKDVGPDESFIKNYSEGEGRREQLESQSIVHWTGRGLSNGTVGWDLCRILV